MSVTEPMAATPRGSNAKMIATVVVIVAFIAGLLVGAVADRIWLFRHGGPRGGHTDFMAARIVDRLSKDLSLTDQQKQQVTTIVTNHGRRISTIMSTVRPQVRQEIDAANKEISALLTPQQRDKFEKLRMRLGPRRGMGGGPGGPPPPE